MQKLVAVDTKRYSQVLQKTCILGLHTGVGALEEAMVGEGDQPIESRKVQGHAGGWDMGEGV
jgi:hypothetical protein